MRARTSVSEPWLKIPPPRPPAPPRPPVAAPPFPPDVAVAPNGATALPPRPPEPARLSTIAQSVMTRPPKLRIPPPSSAWKASPPVALSPLPSPPCRSSPPGALSAALPFVIVRPERLTATPVFTSRMRSMWFPSMIVAPRPDPAIVTGASRSRSPLNACSSAPAIASVNAPAGTLIVSARLPEAHSPALLNGAASRFAERTASRSEQRPSFAIASSAIVTSIVAARADDAPIARTPAARTSSRRMARRYRRARPQATSALDAERQPLGLRVVPRRVGCDERGAVAAGLELARREPALVRAGLRGLAEARGLHVALALLALDRERDLRCLAELVAERRPVPPPELLRLHRRRQDHGRHHVDTVAAA